MTEPATVVNPRRADAVFDWWKRNCSDADGSAGTRARLRRCRSVNDAVSEPAALLLARMVGAIAPGDSSARSRRIASALAAAIVLAHVREHDERTLMRQLGWAVFPGDGATESTAERPELSEVRFKRLMQIRDPDELLTQVTRLVSLSDGKVNVRELSRALLRWDDVQRQRWAFQYYAADIAAPPSNTENDE